MPAPQIILDLIQRFTDQRAAYKAGKYNETQLRRDFLDPFFEALGWDVANRAGNSEKYREVIHEASVEVDGAAKAADYAFRVGEKTIFFVEAKKPAVNIETSLDAAFQARRYGWSAKVPVAVLTDFEQLAVYDCRLKPKHGDAPAVNRVRLYSYQQFADKWDDIAGILSRQAVMKGSFDQFVESSRAKKGTADVDDDFLAEMERWREELARNIALRNPGLDSRAINFAVQTTIDRIIFLRICEDRGMEAENALRDATDGIDVYGDLLALFRQADRKYNSGLFHFSAEKGQSSPPDTLTPALKIDDKILKDILAHLYYPLSPYAFRYISADILGQVYERFLGKVIRLTDGHKAKVVEKPEVRKAGGVYYTPTYIVRYIVEHTVGALLAGSSPLEQEKRPLRVVDPACGSGSFLLGAYQFLLDWYTDWYTANEPAKHARGKNPPVVETRDGWQLTMEKKKQILLDHIYGVDIDAQAVEVTKLSLLLKVVENPGQLSLLAERILPDLGGNIQCGNSLIGSDYYDGRQTGLFGDEEAYRVNAFDWPRAFPHVFAAGGFDAVIGNPPYGASFDENIKTYIRNKFHTYKYKYDSYIYFIEKAILLSRNGGYISFITPELWLKLESSAPLREYIAKNADIDKLFICGENVFEDAVVNTVVFRLHRGIISKGIEIENQKSKWILPSESWKLANGHIIDYRINPKWDSLIEKVKKIAPNPLGKLGEVIQGITPYDKYRGQSPDLIKKRGFHFDHQIDETCGKWLAGKDVSRYMLGWSGEWLKYGPWLAAPRDHRFFSGTRLLFREVPGPGKRIQATFAEGIYYHGHSITPFVKHPDNMYDLKYILGIANSKLISWLGGKTLPNFGKDVFPKMNPQDVSAIPIRTIDFSNPAEVQLHQRIVELVQTMLELHKRLGQPLPPHEQELLQRRIQTTDRAIDTLVYELYGLTEEEIKVVESSAPSP